MSSVATLDAPVKPRVLARRQDIARFNEKPANHRETLRREILGTTLDQVRSLADALGDTEPQTGICVFGGKDALGASKLDLTITEVC